MAYVYQPKGVCPRAITVELEGDVVRSVKFSGGCSGNSQGIAHLVEGMKIEEAVKKLRGIRCGFKTSSCPDQLTYALEEAMAHGEGKIAE